MILSAIHRLALYAIAFLSVAASRMPDSPQPHWKDDSAKGTHTGVTSNHNAIPMRQRVPVFRGRRVQIIYALIDIYCIVAASVSAFVLRFPFGSLSDLLTPTQLVGLNHRYAGFLVIDVALIVLFCQTQRLYRTPLEQPFWVESAAITKAISFATLLLMAFIYLSGVKIVSRSVVAIGALFSTAALICWRYAKRRFILHRIERGLGVRNALIVGSGAVGQALANLLRKNKLLRYRVVGFFDENDPTDRQGNGRIERISRLARARFVDELFVTIPSDRDLVKEVAIAARRDRLAVTVIPDLYDGLGWSAPLRLIGSFPAMDLNWTTPRTAALILKRVMDILLASVGLALTAPIIAVLSLLIIWDSRGPAFYRSRRVGQRGRTFSCYKLRTMVPNADEQKGALRERNERDGPVFKITDDPRITRIGKLLRKYSLDELPQLWNVLVGDMSLVGPRPHPIDDYALYTLDDLRRLRVRPGLTGLWQVTARRDPSFQTSMRLDLDYIDNWNFRMDMRILMRTLSAVLRAEGC
jgi:exopolysaccharide biosynthesis polyprenyl glycosylphosphotransferase